MAAPYLTAEDVRGRAGNLAADTTAGQIDQYVAEFEEIAEDYRGVAFTPRARTLRLTPSASGLILPDPMVSAVSAIAYDTGTAPDPSDVVIEDGYRLVLAVCWPTTQVTVTYTHGYPEPPARLLRATSLYVEASSSSSASGTSRDVLSQTFDGGTTRYSTPDWSAGRPTGWLDVDRLLNSLPDHRVPGIG